MRVEWFSDRRIGLVGKILFVLFVGGYNFDKIETTSFLSSSSLHKLYDYFNCSKLSIFLNKILYSSSSVQHLNEGFL